MKKIFRIYLFFGWLPVLLNLIRSFGWWNLCGTFLLGLWGIIVIAYAIIVFIRWALRSLRDG
jgi:hypothetical protein